MAAKLGFEPRFYVSKAFVLPLDDFAIIWSPHRESNSSLVLEKHLSLSLDDKGLVGLQGIEPCFSL